MISPPGLNFGEAQRQNRSDTFYLVGAGDDLTVGAVVLVAGEADLGEGDEPFFVKSKVRDSFCVLVLPSLICGPIETGTTFNFNPADFCFVRTNVTTVVILFMLIPLLRVSLTITLLASQLLVLGSKQGARAPASTVNWYSSELVVSVRRDASRLGVREPLAKTGMAPTARLTPALFFVTSEKVKVPDMIARERSADLPTDCRAAAEKSHSRAAITWFGVAVVYEGGGFFEDVGDTQSSLFGNPLRTALGVLCKQPSSPRKYPSGMACECVAPDKPTAAVAMTAAQSRGLSFMRFSSACQNVAAIRTSDTG